MSFPELLAFKHSDVVALLPEARKGVIEGKVDRAKANLSKLHSNKEKANCEPLAVVIGIIICLAGLFLTLAAHQVLPHGVNAISDLGAWGQVFGYGGLGLGFIVLLIGAGRSYLKKQDTYEPDTSETRYNAEIAEINAYFPNQLHPNELFAIDNREQKEITLYYRKWNDRLRWFCSASPEVIPCGVLVPKFAFQNWRSRHRSIVESKKFITLDELRVRTEDFERSKLA